MPATATTLGGVKIGSNVAVLSDGTISVAPQPWTVVTRGIAYTGGLVGIGTTDPGTALHVQGVGKISGDADGLISSTGIGQLQVHGVANDNKFLSLGFDTSNNVGVIQAGIVGTGFNNLLLQPQGANVGIGTATPAATLQIREGTNLNIGFTAISGVTALQVTNDAVNAYVPFQYAAASHNFTGGNVGLSVSTPAHLLQLALDDAAKPSTNTWTIASDIRLKQNVRALEGGLDVINRLEPIVGEYNGKAGTPRDGRVVSLDAAKLREILPHAVSSARGKLDPGDATETDILGVNTHEILYHLVLAVQQLSKK